MTRKLIKVLMVVAVGGGMLFEAGGCDTLTSAFLQGVEAGYQAETGESLFGSLLGDGSNSSGSSSYSDWGSDWSDYEDFGPSYYF